MSDVSMTDAKQATAFRAWPMMPTGADPLLRAPFEIATAMYLHWLGTASRLLQDQSAYLQNLAECDDPLNVLVCQTEFAEKSVRAGLDELRRGVDTLATAACKHLAAERVLPQ